MFNDIAGDFQEAALVLDRDKGALGAVVNSVVDALAEFGVTHIEMPVTPERIWRAIHESKKK